MTTGSLVQVTFQEHCLNLGLFFPTISQTMWENPVGLMQISALAPTHKVQRGYYVLWSNPGVPTQVAMHIFDSEPEVLTF
jgi:hypothetical protein